MPTSDGPKGAIPQRSRIPRTSRFFVSKADWRDFQSSLPGNVYGTDIDNSEIAGPGMVADHQTVVSRSCFGWVASVQ